MGKELFNEPDFILMPCLNSRECNKEHSNMRDGTVICSCIQSNDRRILHTEAQQAGKDTFRASSEVITLFKRLRAIINRRSDIRVTPFIGETTFTINKLWVIP